MLKLVVFLGVLFLIYTFLFKKKRVSNNQTQNDEADIMIECPTCGTYISKDEAILSNGKYYCSKECIR
jgi:uncharacterized protein